MLGGTMAARGGCRAWRGRSSPSLAIGARQRKSYFFFGSFLAADCFFCLLTFFGLLSPIVCSFLRQGRHWPT